MTKPGEGPTFDDEEPRESEEAAPAETTAALVAVDPDLDPARVMAAVQASERQAELMLGASLKQTVPQDWIDQGEGRVYLQDSGCQRVNRIWHVSFGKYEFDPPEIETVTLEMVGNRKVEPFEVTHWLYVVTGSGADPRNGRVEWATGMFSTAFPFMRSRYEQAVHDHRIGDVMRMRGEAKRGAVTAMHGKIIRKIAGLEGLMRHDLERYGVDVSRIGKVDRRGASSSAPAAAGDGRPGALSNAQFGKLMGLISEKVEVPANADVRTTLNEAHLTKKGASEMIEGLDALPKRISWPQFRASLERRKTGA